MIQFYTDEHIPKAVAMGLRQRGINVTTTQEAGMTGASDIDQLKFALRNEKILFTQDNDFLKLHSSGIIHSGIVYSHQGTSMGNVIRGLQMIYEVLNNSDMKNHVEFI